MTARILLRSLAAGLLALLAGSALARNDKLLQSIDAAIRSPGTRQLLAPDVPLHFGKASAAGAELAGSGTVHAVADPFGGTSNNGARRERRSDERVCLDAFRKAVVELQARARATGASAVVGIVSNYNGIEMDSPSAYECHVGQTRAVVDLKGQFARALAARQPAGLPAVAQPGMPAAPAAAAVPDQPPRIASGFAAIDDIDAIPYLSDRGRQRYAEWLKWPTPRAFALADNGSFYGTFGLTPKDETLPKEPTERALLMCQRAAGRPCSLYAVNGSVVWARAGR